MRRQRGLAEVGRLGRVTKFVLLMLAVGIGSILSIPPLFVAVMPSPWKEVVILGIVGIALSLAAAVISRWGEKRRKAKELKQLQMEAERQAEEERRLEEAKVVWWQDEKTRREGEERERGKLKEITGQKQEERDHGYSTSNAHAPSTKSTLCTAGKKAGATAVACCFTSAT